MEQEGYWGYHLILDCRGCDKGLVTDRENIYDFTKALVRRIDMVAYGEPIIEHFATHDPDKAGYSLVQLIETSNITAHFVDKSGDGYIDVFSCKPYNTKDVIDVVQQFFNPEHISHTFFHRQA